MVTRLSILKRLLEVGSEARPSGGVLASQYVLVEEGYQGRSLAISFGPISAILCRVVLNGAQ